MSDLELLRLKDEINRGLDYGCSELTKRNIIDLAEGDLPLAVLKLKEWQTRGLLEFVANPFQATDDEICIRMLDYIDSGCPWPDSPKRNPK